MNEKEIETLITQMRQQFKKHFPKKSDLEIDKMILDVFFKAFCEDKMSREDLTTLTNFMGFETNEEILDEVEKEKKAHK